MKLLSLRKPAYQSYTYFDHPSTNSLASKAVDGNRKAIFQCAFWTVVASGSSAKLPDHKSRGFST